MEFEYLRPEDKPALLAVSNPEWLARCLATLSDMDFKVHAVETHDDFRNRFLQFQYMVVIIQQDFGGTAEDNQALAFIQTLAMNLRRHAVVIVIGEWFQTMHPMQAFSQSAHAVVNPSELGSLDQIILKIVADNDLFLHNYRSVLEKMAQGKL